MTLAPNDFILKWVIGDHESSGGSLARPTWHQIAERLAALEAQRDGSISLWMNNGRIDCKILDVQGENGYYMLSLNDFKDGERVFREIYDPSIKGSARGIGGYDYPAELTFQDYDIVSGIFNEFFRTGNVTSLRLHP